MTTLICPKCGTENSSNEVNCRKCQIVLKLALKHTEKKDTNEQNESNKTAKKEPTLPTTSEAENKPISFYKVWLLAFFKPSKKTYSRIANQPNTSTSKAAQWVFISAILSSYVMSNNIITIGLVEYYMRKFLPVRFAHPLISSKDFESSLFFLLMPILAILIIIVFSMGTFTIMWVAEAKGNTVPLNKLAYVLSAIFIPYSILSKAPSAIWSVVHPGTYDYFLYIIAEPLGAILGLYAIVLLLVAIRAIPFKIQYHTHRSFQEKLKETKKKTLRSKKISFSIIALQVIGAVWILYLWVMLLSDEMWSSMFVLQNLFIIIFPPIAVKFSWEAYDRAESSKAILWSVAMLLSPFLYSALFFFLALLTFL